MAERNWAEAWGAEGGLWLTEFGYADTDRQEQAEKLQAVVDWVRDEAAVVRYAWFATRYKGDEAWAVPAAYSTALMACESGELTTLGEAYVRIGAEPAVRVFLPAVVR